MSNPEIMVRIGADAAGVNAGVNQSNAALERLVQEVQRSNSQMQQGFMQSTLALREIARASGETSSAISNMNTQARPAASGMMTGFGAVGLAISGIKQSVELLGQAIKVALGPSAEMQKLQVQFGVLLGSTQAAKQRMQDLVKFADTTPFALPEVAKASKVLETLTKGALSTGEGLRLVGDVAAATGQPFDELAVWFGRLYDGLQSGRPVGEAMQRLQELGAVSGDTRAEIEKLQKEGKKGPEVWGAAKKSFEQYSGMMDAQSKTFEGLASTMQDSLGGVLREFGDQILPTASGATKDLTGFFNDLKPAAAALGWVVSSTVKIFRVAFIAIKAYFQQVIPLVVSGVAEMVTLALTKLIGFAEKINGLFGSVLPESWTKGIGDGLAAAKAWAGGVNEQMREVGATARKELGDVGEQMLNVYAPAEEIDVPGKKKNKSGMSDEQLKLNAQLMASHKATQKELLAEEDKRYKSELEIAGKNAKLIEEVKVQHAARLAEIGKKSGATAAAAKHAKEEAKQKEEEEKALAKASEDRFVTLQKNKQQLQIASAKEGRERELVALNLKLKDEVACYEDGSKEKLAIEAKYQAERSNINAKWDAKREDAERKTLTAYANVLKHQAAQLKKTLEEQQKLYDKTAGKLVHSMTSALTTISTTDGSLRHKMVAGWQALYQGLGHMIVQELANWIEIGIKKLVFSNSIRAADAAAAKAAAAENVATGMATGAALSSAYSTAAAFASTMTFGGAALEGGLALAATVAEAKTLGAMPAFAMGTPTVPRDMVAQIHKGETIVPATFAEGIRKGEMTLGGPGGSKGGSSGNEYGASVVLGPDIIHAIENEGRALFKIIKNQNRKAFLLGGLFA